MWNQHSAWGWPSNQYNYQYNQPQDTSAENWAAAAALWAQQRQMQEQYEQNMPRPPGERPPEPPGPPPAVPSAPPIDNTNVEVHDYNHGNNNVEQAPEVIDYQHQNVPTGPPDVQAPEVIDYNHGNNEVVNQQEYNNSWDYNHSAWQDNSAYYQQNVAQNWGEWQPNAENDFNNANHHNGGHGSYNHHEHSQHYDHSQTHSKNNHHKHTNHQHNNHHSNHHQRHHDDHSGGNTPDPVEVNKKKSLPLWLRDGLEKLEKDKKKQVVKKTLPDAKKISGYQHASPGSSPEQKEESDAELSDKEATPVKDRSPSPSLSPKRPIRRPPSSDEGEDNEEEKQKKLMLKIKTWMTETLLGVTNSELKTICEEVYFEMKRSAKTKATQVRRSGGLEALRVAAGDDEITSSEEEEEPSPPPKRTEVKATIMSHYKKESHTESMGTKPSSVKTIQREKDDSRYDKYDSEQRSNEKSNDNGKAELNKKTKELEIPKSSKKKKNRKASVSEEDTEEDSYYTSDDSERSRERKKSRKKSKRRRSSSRSPTRKSRKKSKYESDDSEREERRRKKKKKKERYSSSEEEEDDDDYSSDYSSPRRKKKSRGKKHKRKDRSVSRSPKRSKRKR